MSRVVSASDFRFPGEFERHKAIWLGWPTHDAMQGLSTLHVYLQLIRVLVQYVPVRIAVQDDTAKEHVRYVLTAFGIPLTNVELLSIPHDDIWFRDMGPIFLIDAKGNKLVQSFGFNGWGYEELDTRGTQLDQDVASRVAELLELPLHVSPLISEGGDREFNGKGTMIAVEAVERQRNPTLSRDEIEETFKAVFNIRHVVWLKQGVYDDDLAFDGALPGPAGLSNIVPCLTTGGHIDEHCRFVSPDTVLVAEVTESEAKADPIAAETRRRMEINVDILRRAMDQDGNELSIKRIPAAAPLFSTVKDGDYVYEYYKAKYRYGFISPLANRINIIAAASYNNFLITNGVVVAPEYWKPGLPSAIRDKDLHARQILEDLFPNREIRTIDVRALNIGGGGIHCVTQQEPESEAT